MTQPRLHASHWWNVSTGIATPSYPSNGEGGETTTAGSSHLLGATRVVLEGVMFKPSGAVAGDFCIINYFDGSGAVLIIAPAFIAAGAGQRFVPFGRRGLEISLANFPAATRNITASMLFATNLTCTIFYRVLY